MPSIRCPHGNQKRDCKICRHNRYAAISRKQVKERKQIKTELWTCPNCHKRHNTQEDKVCYYCFKPRGER